MKAGLVTQSLFSLSSKTEKEDEAKDVRERRALLVISSKRRFAAERLRLTRTALISFVFVDFGCEDSKTSRERVFGGSAEDEARSIRCKLRERCALVAEEQVILAQTD